MRYTVLILCLLRYANTVAHTGFFSGGGGGQGIQKTKIYITINIKKIYKLFFFFF